MVKAKSKIRTSEDKKAKMFNSKQVEEGKIKNEQEVKSKKQ